MLTTGSRRHADHVTNAPKFTRATLIKLRNSSYWRIAVISGEVIGAGTTVDPQAGTFTAELLEPGEALDGRRLAGFAGRWLVRDGLILAAIAVPAGDTGGPAAS